MTMTATLVLAFQEVCNQQLSAGTAHSSMHTLTQHTVSLRLLSCLQVPDAGAMGEMNSAEASGERAL